MLQTNCLEFLVSGSLDGTTPNPIFERADSETPRPDPPGTDAENIYRFEVENLGILDLDFPAVAERPDGTVTRGNRYVTWLVIDTGGPQGGAGAGVNVVAYRPDSNTPIVQEPIEDLENEIGLYRKACIFVPHGSALQLTGVDADAGTPILVRLSVALPRTREEEEDLINACCCMAGYFTLFAGCLLPPDPQSVNPTPIAAPATTTVDVIGQNFENGDVVTMPGLTVGATTFVDSTNLQVDVTTLIGDAGQTYDVVVTRPGDAFCEGTLEDGIAVIAPG
jgi:hypothetical protein